MDALDIELATFGGFHDPRRHPLSADKALYHSWYDHNRKRPLRFPDDQPVPKDVWAAIWSGQCFRCGQTPARGVDHIVPKCKGGRNVIENLQPACVSCNKRKQARLMSELLSL